MSALVLLILAIVEASSEKYIKSDLKINAKKVIQKNNMKLFLFFILAKVSKFKRLTLLHLWQSMKLSCLSQLFS